MRRKTINRILQYEYLAYLIMFITATLVSGISAWPASFFFVNYQEFGFISRGFVGTILRLVNPQIDPSFIITFFKVISISGLFLYSYIACLAHQNADEEERTSILLMSACGLLAVFSSHIGIFNTIGRYELFFFFPYPIVLLGLKKRSLAGTVFLFLYSVTSILVHQVFVFLFFPAIICVLLLQKRYKLFVLYSGFCFAVFSLVQFFGKADYLQVTEYVLTTMRSFALDEEDIELVREAVHYEYGMDVWEHRRDFHDLSTVLGGVVYKERKWFPFSLITSAGQIWILCRIAYKKIGKKLFFCIAVCLFFIGVQYFLTVDYSRWLGELYCVYVFTVLMFTFVLREEKPTEHVSHNVHHPWIYILMPLVSASPFVIGTCIQMSELIGGR